MEGTAIPGYRFLVTNPDRFGGNPRESIAEVLRFAAEVTDRHDVAARRESSQRSAALLRSYGIACDTTARRGWRDSDER